MKTSPRTVRHRAEPNARGDSAARGGGVGTPGSRKGHRPGVGHSLVWACDLLLRCSMTLGHFLLCKMEIMIPTAQC